MSRISKKYQCKECNFYVGTGNVCKRYPATAFPMQVVDDLGRQVMQVMMLDVQVKPENWCGEFVEYEAEVKPLASI